MQRRNSINRQRMHEAARWFADHESGRELDDITLDLWGEWCADPANSAAYVSLICWHQQFATFDRPKGSTGEELREDLRRMMMSSNAKSAQKLLRSGSYSWWFPDRLSRAAAWLVACIVAVGLGLLLRWAWLAGMAGTERVYTTVFGEQRELILEDGSVMTLGAGTSVSVRLTRANRLVVLSRGEGMFRVRHEAGRPFTVCARSACATAVGTIFDVHLYTSRLRTWVQQGAIDVRLKFQSRRHIFEKVGYADMRGTTLRLLQGQELNYDLQHGAGETRAMDVRAATAWTRGSMAYSGSPLSEVLEDVQRYWPRHILLDPATAGMTYSGTVLQRQIEHWLMGLPKIFPIEVIDCGSPSSSSRSLDAHETCVGDRSAIVIRPRTTQR